MGHRQSFHWDEATFSSADGRALYIFEITVRVTDGQHLFRPDKALGEVVWGVIGRARSKYDFQFLGFHMLSNHYSMIIGVYDAKGHTEIKRFINGNIAKEVNKLRGRSGALQGRRSRSIQIESDAVLLERMAYSMANGCAENLVERPEDWPGPHFANAVIEGNKAKGIWYDRTLWWKERAKDQSVKPSDYTESYTITFDTLPALSHMSDAEYAVVMKELADRATADRVEQFGTKAPLGVEKIHAGSTSARTELRRRRSDKATKKGKRTAPAIYASCDEGHDAYRTAYRNFVGSAPAAASPTESPPAKLAA